MPKDNKFNQSKYIQQYIKDNYTECKLRLKPDESAKVDSFIASKGYKKSRFFIQAAMYIIDNNIELPTNRDKSDH